MSMRLALSLFAAVALHGIALGMTAARQPSKPSAWTAPPPIEVEVDVTAPRPDVVADAVKTSADHSSSQARSQPESTRQSARTASPVREVVPAAEPVIVDSAAVDSAPVSERPSAPVAASAPTPFGAVNTSNAHAAVVPAPVSAPAPPSGIVASAKPRYRSNPAPDYPVPSRRRQEEGIVLLNVLVRPDGLPATVSLNRSSGYPLLDRAALDAVNRWTFEPARAAGVPVSSTILIPIRFSLSDAR